MYVSEDARDRALSLEVARNILRHNGNIALNFPWLRNSIYIRYMNFPSVIHLARLYTAVHERQCDVSCVLNVRIAAV